MFAVTAADALIAVAAVVGALALLASTVHHAIVNGFAGGWLLAIILLPVAGPLLYLWWNLGRAREAARREAGRAGWWGRGRLIARAEAIEQRRAANIVLPAETKDLAHLRFALGDDPKVEALCREYLEEHADDIDIRYLLGRTCARQGRHREAVEAFQDVVRADPRHATGEAMLGLARGFLALDDATRAALALDEVNARYDLPEALVIAGQLKEKEGDLEAARALYERARHSAQAATGERRRLVVRWEREARRALEAISQRRRDAGDR